MQHPQRLAGGGGDDQRGDFAVFHQRQRLRREGLGGDGAGGGLRPHPFVVRLRMDGAHGLLVVS
jgi:hypothetical protein